MLAVEVTPRAAIQIETAAAWWAKNRPFAPDAIRVDFQEAKSLLSGQPGVGARSSSARYSDLVRVGKIVIAAFWHASRGSGPSL